MEQLKRRFVEGCSARSEEITSLLASLQSNGDESALRSLHGAMHKLGGSAGLFGFHKTGAIARDCERRIEEALKNGGASVPASLPALVDELQEAIRQEVAAVGNLVTSPEGEERTRRAVIVSARPGAMTEALSRELVAAGLLPEVVAVESSLEACRRAEVALIDVAAGGDGYALCRSIAEAPQAPPIRILYTDGNTTFDLIRASPSRASKFIYRASDVRGALKRQEQPGEVAATARILSVEDDPDCGRVIEESLRSVGHTVKVIHSPALLLEELARFRPELLLLDWDLPDVNGYDLARIIRSDARHERMPIVFCTSRSERYDRRAASRAGADDFVAKPFTPEELIEAVDTHLTRYRALRRRMDHDALTDLLNRAASVAAIDDLLAGARERGTGVLVAIVDLDHFKSVNDDFGHPTGDRVLREMAAHLRSSLRAFDVAGRLGGEEFVVAMEGPTLEPLAQKLDDTRKSVSIRVERSGVPSRGITFSAGVAWFPEHGTQAPELLKQADLALYRAKEAGRNQIVIAHKPAT